jgi:hypothetical protein
MFARDAAQLAENVHFEIQWSDRSVAYTKNINGKYLELTLNLFADKNEK